MNKQVKSTRLIFQENLRYYRRKRHLTQAQLADRAQVHRTYISEIESGKCSPSIDIVGRIAEAFDIPGWQLLFPHEKEAAGQKKGKQFR